MTEMDRLRRHQRDMRLWEARRRFDYSGGISEAEVLAVLRSGRPEDVEALNDRILAAGLSDDPLLLFSASNGYLEALRLLLDQGEDVDVRDFNGRTALMAASVEYPEIVKLLIERGADVNARREGRVTVLMVAAQYSYEPKCIELLVAHGASMKALDRRGRTALMRIIEKTGVPGLTNAETLLRLGADVHATHGETGLTAIQMYCSEEHEEFVRLLERYGAKSYYNPTWLIC